MSHHVPTNSELSKLNEDNKASIRNNDDKISTLASTVVNQSTLINAQNSQVSKAVDNSEKAMRQVDYLSVSNESNSLAIEDLIPMSMDASMVSVANAEALEDVIPQVLDHSEMSDVISVAVEDIISEVYENEDQMEELMDKLKSISESMTEITNKLNELNGRLDVIESIRG